MNRQRGGAWHSIHRGRRELTHQSHSARHVLKPVLPIPAVANFEAHERPRLIPEGEYIGLVRGWRPYLYISRHPKIALEIELVGSTDGDTTHAGAILARHWNVARVDTKKRTFVAKGWCSDFVREFVAVTGTAPDRLDRIPMSKLRGDVVCRVRTVRSDRDNDELPALSQYSVIGKLVRACNSNRTAERT